VYLLPRSYCLNSDEGAMLDAKNVQLIY